MHRLNLPIVDGGPGGVNVTLSQSELEACGPIRAMRGRKVRAFCPFHCSDHQRSLAVDMRTGRFHCFACGAWGYMKGEHDRFARTRYANGVPIRNSVERGTSTVVRNDLTTILRNYQLALPQSPGVDYLRLRGISLVLAQKYGVGYAANGKWAHPARDWKWGRVVFPHTTPDGQLVNLYGRAVDSSGDIPRVFRHDHLPGPKGYFNAPVLASGEGTVFITESPFDALSLIAIGVPCTLAVFGVTGWCWEWVRKVREVAFALDADATGQRSWRELAREARLRGKMVTFLPPEAYDGHKDVNEAWVAGALRIDL